MTMAQAWEVWRAMEANGATWAEFTATDAFRVWIAGAEAGFGADGSAPIGGAR